jgi:hypothetical protein
MTTESAAPEVLHVWAIYLRASEEARRRGDRRTGTDHVLLALLEDPSIEVVLGVSLQQARQALESLDREALGALGLGSGTDAPPLPMRAVPKKPRIRDVAKKDRFRMTPAAKKVLQEAVKPRSAQDPWRRPMCAGVRHRKGLCARRPAGGARTSRLHGCGSGARDVYFQLEASVRRGSVNRSERSPASGSSSRSTTMFAADCVA